MTNRQAAQIRPGMTIRRTVPYANRPTVTDRETFTVERVEHPSHRSGEVAIYAGGQVFMPEEIERVRHPDNEQTP